MAFSDHGFEGRIIEDGERKRKKKRNTSERSSPIKAFFMVAQLVA